MIFEEIWIEVGIGANPVCDNFYFIYVRRSSSAGPKLKHRMDYLM